MDKPSSTVPAAPDIDPERVVTVDPTGAPLPPSRGETFLDPKDLQAPQELDGQSEDLRIAVRLSTGSKSAYRPEFINLLARFATMGYSLESSAAKLGFHPRTIDRWAADNEEFRDALEIIEGLRLFHLEGRALNSRVTSSQATILLRALSRLSPRNWGEKIELDGAAGISGVVILREIFERVSRESMQLLEQSTRARVEASYVEIDQESGTRVSQPIKAGILSPGASEKP